MHPSADTGRVIAGRYRLQAPIGRGAMGVVWRARDQLLDRDVAIKEVQIADTLTEAERATAFQRTLREAKTAARLNHPAVVTVYDVAEDGGRPWIVMQLVHAQSLDQMLAASGPLSPRRAAEMARQLLSALSVAHAAGVMHRDVKPSNVLLGSGARAVLTAFGIATFADDPKLTQTGMVMGSPGFTAPERIRGEDASPASDLWSLGATIYAAVEGHGPFEQRGGAITTMSAIINEEAPEAPTAGALGPVIAALLRREPGDRPDASAAARMTAGWRPGVGGDRSDHASAVAAVAAVAGRLGPGCGLRVQPGRLRGPGRARGQAGGPGARFLLLVQPVPQARRGVTAGFRFRTTGIPFRLPTPGGLCPGGLVGPALAAAAALVRRRVRAVPAATVRLRVEGGRRGAGDHRRGGRGGHGRAPAPGSFRLAAGSGHEHGFGVRVSLRVVLGLAPAPDAADHRRHQQASHRAAAQRIH